MEENEWNLKEEFDKLRLKHNLPEFSKMAEDFDIEKLADKETTFLLREIRRIMNEKISAYLHLVENLLNPSGPSMFLMSVIKNIDSTEKELIKDLYKKMSLIQIKTMKLDTVYSEKEEILFINSIFIEWQDLKKSLFKLIGSFDSKFTDNSSSVNRGYYG